MTADGVKEVLRRMSVSERCEVLAWLVELDDDAWDKQIEDDANAGRLDKLLGEVGDNPKIGLALLASNKTHLQIAAEIEDYVADIVSGAKTKLRSAYDLISANGVRFEVKWSRLSRPKGGGGGTQNWTWAHLLGRHGAKVFDRLILVAEPNPAHRSLYADPSCKYVLFDVPFEELPMVMNVGKNNLQLNSNPSAVRKSKIGLQRMYKEFAVTEKQLSKKY